MGNYEGRIIFGHYPNILLEKLRKETEKNGSEPNSGTPRHQAELITTEPVFGCH